VATGPKKKIMRSLKIDEISGVDRPAQEGARSLILKRRDSQTDIPVEKKAVLTSSENGHSHLIDLEYRGGQEPVAGMTSYVDDHNHPWVMDEDGKVVIGEARGHNHEAATVSKAGATDIEQSTEDETMTKTDAEKIADLEKSLAKANKLAALDDATKAYHSALPDNAAKDAFLAKSADEQKAEVAAAVAKAKKDKEATAEEDPVVYTTKSGIELRKSVGDAFVALAKQNDELLARVEKTDATNETLRLTKRAEEELKFLPGTVETRVALLKSVEAIENKDQREAALTALKAQNDAMSAAFKEHGVRVGNEEVGSAEDEIDRMAKEYATKNNVTEAAAYDAVLKTAAGQAAYAKTATH
jgi:hypothetical protein